MFDLVSNRKPPPPKTLGGTTVDGRRQGDYYTLQSDEFRKICIFIGGSLPIARITGSDPNCFDSEASQLRDLMKETS